MAKDGKFHFWGFLAALIFGLGLGAITYCITKMCNLKSKWWILLFAFMPPVIGFVIYVLSNSK